MKLPTFILNGFKTCLAILVVGVAFATTPAHAAVILSHSGSTNPVTEGWTLNKGTNVDINAGAYNDGGVQTWQINNVNTTPGTHQLYYNATINNDLSTGWKLDLSLKSVGVNLSPGAQSTVLFVSEYDASGNKLTGNNRISYQIYFGTTATGALRIQIVVGGVATNVTYTASGTYQTLSLAWNPGDVGATLSVDGTAVKTGFMGDALSSSARSNLSWGNLATSTATNRSTNWESIQFSVVPEPSSLILFGAAAGALALARARFRKAPATV